MTTPGVNNTESLNDALTEVLAELGPARLAMYASIRQDHPNLSHKSAKMFAIHLGSEYSFIRQPGVTNDTIRDGLHIGLNYAQMLSMLNRKGLGYLLSIIIHVSWNGIALDDAIRLMNADLPHPGSECHFATLLRHDDVSVERIIEVGTAIKRAGLDDVRARYAYRRVFQWKYNEPNLPLDEAIRQAAALKIPEPTGGSL